MSRSKMIFVGGLCRLACVLVVSAGLSVSSVSGAAAHPPNMQGSPVASLTPAAQAGGVMTAQAGSPVAPLQVTAGPYRAVPPADGQPGIGPYYLVLTVQDSGRAFTVPVNALILVDIPFTPFTRLRYDPTILQPVPYAGSYPSLEPGAVIPPEPYGRLLRAISPGTTLLLLVQMPCTTRPCPAMPIYNFTVTITVSGAIVPPPYPTLYPPIPVVPDVYIGTADLVQTVTVQPGQIVELDLPFLAPQESVTVSYDANILQLLDGQALGSSLEDRWFFRVIGTGTTDLVIEDIGCLPERTPCMRAIAFSVTIQASA